MPLGAYAPLPLRLGGTATDGVTASQFKRLTGDLSSFFNTAPSAVFHVSKSGATVTISNYVGWNGSGSGNAPTATVNGSGDVSLEFTNPIFKNDLNQYQQIIIRMGDARSATNAEYSSLELVDGQTVRLRTFDFTDAGVDGAAVVTLWWDRNSRIGDYGGDPAKENSKTEGDTPYAWSVYTELQAMRGDAFSQERSGVIHAENLALARLLAYSGWRHPEERENNNASPARASSKLGYWAAALDVRNSPGDQPWQVRNRCNAAFRAVAGNSVPDIDDAFRELLGDALVSINRLNTNDLSNPPETTYYPVIAPGPTELDLGGGAWMSSTSFVYVTVQKPSSSETVEFRQLMDTDWFAIADKMFPAWVTFGWNTGTGFILNQDQLSLDAL